MTSDSRGTARSTRVLSLETLTLVVEETRRNGGRIVLCDGHFNLLHPGHHRFLRFCQQQGDVLIAAVHGTDQLDPERRAKYFALEARTEMLAQLALVDVIYPLDRSVAELIRVIRPNVWVKGAEFQERQSELSDALEALSSCGGEVVYGAGEISYHVDRLMESARDLRPMDTVVVRQALSRHNESLESLAKVTSLFPKLHLGVLGDFILDEYISCDVLGVSAEAPVLTIRELSKKRFIGGAGIVAAHLASLGAESTLFTVLGDDDDGTHASQMMTDARINLNVVRDHTRPTTVKVRYVVDQQKVLRVSRLAEHRVDAQTEARLLAALAQAIPKLDGLIVSDFVYGVVTDRLLSRIVTLAQKHNCPLFGDVQCSSQVGDVGRLRGMQLITPTEKEARIALQDKTCGLEELARRLQRQTQTPQVLVTLGSRGMLLYVSDDEKNPTDQGEFFPALATSAVDPTGAGDALLAGYSLALAAGVPPYVGAVFGSIVAAQAVMQFGNIPVKRTDVETRIANFVRGHSATGEMFRELSRPK